MGAPAARVGDLTGHGTPLGPGPGAITVLIGGKPAWRASDFHNCPLFDGLAPHVGGNVGIGSTTVLIGGAPAVRRGDSVVESRPPNVIVTGAADVLIG
jgi:uncharacterized Zn-binding protein involved in type VI secretion